MIHLEGPLSYTSSALSLKGEVHLNVGALLDIIWFGKIGEFSRSNYFYLPAFGAPTGGGGVSTLWHNHPSWARSRKEGIALYSWRPSLSKSPRFFPADFVSKSLTTTSKILSSSVFYFMLKWAKCYKESNLSRTPWLSCLWALWVFLTTVLYTEGSQLNGLFSINWWNLHNKPPMLFQHGISLL
jgi:hypothetical protein